MIITLLVLTLIQPSASRSGSLRWHQLKNRLDKSMERVRLVLEQAKTPKLADEVHHRYEDKFLLAESLTSAALASQLNHFAMLGLSRGMLERLHGWAYESNTSTPVLLKMQAQEKCHFLRKETKEVEDKRKEVTEVSTFGVVTAALAKKVVTTVDEYIWRVDVPFQLLATKGVPPTKELVVRAKNASTELRTVTDANPCETNRRHRTELAEDVDIRWLLRTFSLATSSPMFNINRTDEQCLTPYRNPQVKQAIDFFTKYTSWARLSQGHLKAVMRFFEPKFDKEVAPFLDGTRLPSLFVPVLPLLRDEVAAADADKVFPAGGDGRLAGVAGRPHNGTALLSDAELTRLLAEEFRSLRAEQERIESKMEEPAAGAGGLATAAEGTLLMTLSHSVQVINQCLEALQYIEDMMQKQLVAALGKEITPGDFAEYMGYHSRRLFDIDYLPKPFSYAVRRSAHHSPEGTLNIQKASAPIATMVSREDHPDAMFMALSASSTVTIHGDRYLHGWLSHEFNPALTRGYRSGGLELTVKANQFSGFIVVVGQIASPTTFDAKYASIVQNKDELTIPLELSTIPTPLEFKDAIESLSPKQQAFARAFRAMQLDSTLFGILVIQIKPQLEKVLNLPPDSLTKNIKLTQDLMQLFIKYQIPTDLLSFDVAIEKAAGDAENGTTVTPADRIATVAGHVSAMMAMIQETKKEDLGARRQEECYKNGGRNCGYWREGWIDEEEAEDTQELQQEEPDEMASFASAGADVPLAVRSFARVGNAVEGFVEAEHMAELGYSSDMPKPSKAKAQLKRRQKVGAAAPPTASTSADGAGQAAEEQRTEPEAATVASIRSRDYTRVPKDMDEQFEKLDVDAVLRPTIIKASTVWSKTSQAALLAEATTVSVHADEQEHAKDSAFHLLDALTKSGALAIDDASLHIVVAATHRFDKDIIETVVQDNVNPIEKAERSLLIMASTVHERPASSLISPSQQERVQIASPILFDAGGSPSSAVVQTV